MDGFGGGVHQQFGDVSGHHRISILRSSLWGLARECGVSFNIDVGRDDAFAGKPAPTGFGGDPWISETDAAGCRWPSRRIHATTAHSPAQETRHCVPAIARGGPDR